MKKQLLNILLLFVLAFSYGQSVLPPNLLSPSKNAPNRDVSIRLDWAVTINNQGYIVEIDTNQNFNTGAFQTVTTSNSNQNFTHLRFGTTYYWRVRARNSLGASPWSVTRSFVANLGVGLTEVENSKIELFPNPTSDYFTIKSEKEILLRIYSLDGKLVRQEKITNQSSKIDVSNLNSGIYSLIIESDTNQFVTKLIKK